MPSLDIIQGYRLRAPPLLKRDRHPQHRPRLHRPHPYQHPCRPHSCRLHPHGLRRSECSGFRRSHLHRPRSYQHPRLEYPCSLHIHRDGARSYALSVDHLPPRFPRRRCAACPLKLAVQAAGPPSILAVPRDCSSRISPRLASHRRPHHQLRNRHGWARHQPYNCVSQSIIPRKTWRCRLARIRPSPIAALLSQAARTRALAGRCRAAATFCRAPVPHAVACYARLGRRRGEALRCWELCWQQQRVCLHSSLMTVPLSRATPFR